MRNALFRLCPLHILIAAACFALPVSRAGFSGEKALVDDANRVKPGGKVPEWTVLYIEDKLPRFKKLWGQLEIVAIGDSRTECGIEPEFFSDPRNAETPIAFNMAITSSGIFTYRMMTDTYLLKTPKLKWVVWGVETRNFNQYWGEATDLIVADTAWYKADKKGAGPAPTVSPVKKDQLTKTRRTTLLGQNGQKQLPVTDAAWQAQQLNDLPPARFKFSDARWAAFESIVKTLNDKNIKVIIYLPPIHHLIDKAQVTDDDGTGKTDYDDIVKRLQALEARYPNVWFRDLYKKGDNEFKDDDYCNLDHLSKSGAEKLTKLIDAIIKDPPKKQPAAPSPGKNPPKPAEATQPSPKPPTPAPQKPAPTSVAADPVVPVGDGDER
jgi:hypothetical protein